MNPELYLTFVLATILLIIIPGPNVSLIVANAIAFGRRQGLVTVAGTATAQVFQLAVVAFGMTSFMLLLAQWFEWLRWAGVAYLLWLGYQHWREDPASVTPEQLARRASTKTAFWRGALVAATNPKVLFFYAAFFPQFIDPGLPPAPQLALLCTTFLAIATLLDSGWALLAAQLHSWLGNSRRARIRNRITGSLMIGAAAGLALARRGS